MNIINYAARLYDIGHVAQDFDGAELKKGMVILSPVLPPTLYTGGAGVSGLFRPEMMRKVPGQYALSHRVEAMGEQTETALKVKVGDVVKCREGHLDILDPTGRLVAIRDEHIIAKLAVDEQVAAEASPVPS